MRVHLRDCDIHLISLRTRMPFRYGIATMTEAPHALVRLRTEVDGKLATGVAADHLPPKWFTKDPTRPIGDEVDEMLRVIEQVFSKEATPKDALTEAQQACQAELEKVLAGNA